jgi:hypothetical protein
VRLPDHGLIQEEQAAYEARRLAKAAARKAEEARVAKLEEARRIEQQRKEEEASRVQRERQEDQDWGVMTCSTDDVVRFGFPMEDASGKFDKKVEYIRTWFKQTDLQSFGVAGPSLCERFYCLSWRFQGTTESPVIDVFYGPQSRRIAQIDVWGGIDLAHRDRLVRDLAKLPSFRNAVRAAIELVAPEELDGGEKWLNGFPQASSAPPDLVKFHDFGKLSVAMSQVTTHSVFPTLIRVTEWRVKIVPNQTAFRVFD